MTSAEYGSGGSGEKLLLGNKGRLPGPYADGVHARIEEIMAVADRLAFCTLPVIEKPLRPIRGGHIRGRYLGGYGAIGQFSFDSMKSLTTGEGDAHHG
jgi:dTDP-4-amino-4,6-dideoxygalactose transaminase